MQGLFSGDSGTRPNLIIRQEADTITRPGRQRPGRTDRQQVVVSTPNSSPPSASRSTSRCWPRGAGHRRVPDRRDLAGHPRHHFIDLGLKHDGRRTEHFPAIVENNTVDGQLVAMPWFTDAGVLYYRADLLEKHGENPRGPGRS
jgi:trehalose/maltose transport system substrate-binding protein